MQQIVLRTPEGSSGLQTSVTDKKVSISPATGLPKFGSTLVWSECSSFFLSLGSNRVSVYNSNLQLEKEMEVLGIHAAAFSPQANFLVTFQKPIEGSNSDKNLKVWDWRKQEVKLQMYQKSFSKDAWPQIQLTYNERHALHQVTNNVNIYDLEDPAAGIVKKLGLKGVGGFGVSRSADQPVVAAYVPEGKGVPGYVGLWRIADLQKSPQSPPPYARRSFFKATGVTLVWNKPGTAVLAITYSEVDSTNKSYYGEQKLHYLCADGTIDCMVPLPKDGPVHDVQWSPSGSHFVTVSGYMPAKVNLFNARCKMLHELNTGPYNLVRWNPQGRFVAVAGFGNLPGDIGLHELSEGKTTKPLGAAKADDGVSLEWSPDGRHLLVATLAPRMRVNNGIQLFKYTGDLLAQEKYHVLLEASWLRHPEGTFEDRPSSPRTGAAAKNAPSAAPIRAAGYVPPRLRGAGGAAPAGGFSLSSENKPRLGKPAARYAVPGAEPEGTSKPKSKKSGSKGSSKAQGDSTNTAVQSGQNNAPSQGMADMSLNGGGNEAAADPAKRIRNLKKKLTQIQQLKDKLATGKALEPEQQDKLDSEASILEEIQNLEAT